MTVTKSTEAVAPLSRGVLADHVADYIVEAIAHRQLLSGQKLNELDLAKTLGTSRVPVREATRMLASQGIVIASPRRGMRVANFDSEWATQLRDARIAIERLAAQIVADKVQKEPKAIRPLLDQIALIERTSENAHDGWLSVNRADIAFHAAIFEIADSPLLSTLWSGIARHVLILFAKETFRYSALGTLASQHQRYVEALQSGDPEALAEEVASHIRDPLK